MISIVCWKWKPEDGTKHQEKRERFSARHVNILRNMLERNLTIPHKFICVTDDWKGLHSSVFVVNIDWAFRDYAYLGGCYRRLKAFGTHGRKMFGDRFISLDLDCVIAGNIDHIIGFQDDFRIWQDGYRRFTPYCGSLWGMKAETRSHVWDRFHSDPVASIRRANIYQGTDQAHISACLYPNEAVWTKEKDGIYNFNTQVRRCPNRIYKRGSDTIMEHLRSGELPKDARIVFFNGKYDPSQEQLWKHHEWIGDLWR